MTPNELGEDALYDEVHRLVTAVLEEPSPEVYERLAEFLAAGGPKAEQCYTSYMHDTHALRSAGSTVSQILPTVQSGSHGAGLLATKQRSRRTLLMRLSAVVAVAASLFFAFLWWQPNEPPNLDRTLALEASSNPVATLVRASRVRWHPEDTGLSELSRLEPGMRLRIESGQVEILFDSGVELIVAGRADAMIDSSMRVVAKLGRYSARVSERGRGFTIETPATDVIDLGTEFGVEIDPSGGTKVAVFQGEVDLKYGKAQAGIDDPVFQREPERLRVGEAVQIDIGGQRRRLVAVGSDDFPIHGFDHSRFSSRPVLFSAVRDNIRSASNKKFYRVIHSGLFDDARAYVDRNHEWNGLDSHGLPSILRGADYVMTFNSDKFATDFEMTLQMSGPCTLYIFFNNNMTTPDWLVASFQDTGIDLGLDQAYGRYSGDSSLAVGGGMSIDNTFSLWARTIHRAGEVQLGGVDRPDDVDAGWSMYGIAAKPILASDAGR